MIDAIAGVFSSATAAGTAFLGSKYTQQSVNSAWYSCIRPSFAPPSWIFPVAWTLLYIILAVAFGKSIISDASTVIVLHVVNLFLNIAWCRAFFGKRQPGEAFLIILLNLTVAFGIVATTRQPSVRWLLIPYIIWLSFATTLNAHSYIKRHECTQSS